MMTVILRSGIVQFDQRDEHIRRYAELIEARSKIQVSQSAAPEIGYKKPPPQEKRLLPQNAAPVSKLADGRRAGPQHGKAIPRQIAEETGLSVDTVRRALNPRFDGGRQ